MAAPSKYFVQPFLANLFQKREGNGPGGLSYLPEVSDVSNIPEGVNYFYYTGEDTADYINGYIYKKTTTTVTEQVWEIITPAVTEHKVITVPAGGKYIDVVADGYQIPIGKYYQTEELPAASIQFERAEYLGTDGKTYYSSELAIIQAGDYVWRDGVRYKVTERGNIYLMLDNGVKVTCNGGGGSLWPEFLYVSEAGVTCYFALTLINAGIGVIRTKNNTNYLYCDGLYNIPNTAYALLTDEGKTFETDIIITPAVWGWVEKEVEVITWSQHDAQPRAVAKVESTDGTKFIVVENSGTTIEGDVIAKNNVTVKGNLYVEGTEIVTDVETVQSEDDFIKLRFGNQSALGEGQSGLQVLNFDGNGATMYLVVSGDGILRLGLGNELEPVTTRDEAAAMVDGAVTVWNATAQKIKTGPAASKLVQSEEVKTIKALSQEAYDDLSEIDPDMLYLIRVDYVMP